MNREEICRIASELELILKEKKISPNDVESVVYVLQENVRKENELQRNEYMRKGVYGKSLPE